MNPKVMLTAAEEVSSEEDEGHHSVGGNGLHRPAALDERIEDLAHWDFPALGVIEPRPEGGDLL